MFGTSLVHAKDPVLTVELSALAAVIYCEGRARYPSINISIHHGSHNDNGVVGLNHSDKVRD